MSLPKTTPFVGTSKASTSGYNKESRNNKGNTFSLSNSFEALNYEKLIIYEVASGSMATTSGTQEEGQSSTHIVDKINVLEKQILEGKLVLVDDDGKPLKNIDYLGDLGNDDEVEPIDNEMTTFLASKPIGVGYGSKCLLEQWRKSNVKDDYNPYDDDMYEGKEFPDNIHTICDNLDIKVCGRKKK
ncbi:hypothetical protein Tco_0092976 [Tanacetum coccineum]